MRQCNDESTNVYKTAIDTVITTFNCNIDTAVVSTHTNI